MAEKIVSPGVFTNEVDQSFLPAGVAAIGAAVIGPTATGPANIPITVTSYSEFVNIFGGVIESGSGAQKNIYKYLTNYSAQEYLKYADTLTVVRILDGTFSPASASITSTTTTGNSFSSGSITIAKIPSGSVLAGGADEISIGSVDFTFVSESAGLANSATQIFVEFPKAGGATTVTTVAENLRDAINNNVTTHGLAISASNASGVIAISGSSVGELSLTVATGSGGDAVATTLDFAQIVNIEGGTNTSTSTNCFTLTTLSDGEDQNSGGSTSPSTFKTNNLLSDGTVNNIRFEVNNVNNTRGTFQLLIRRGDDTDNRKKIVEQYNNINLDPNSPNYIGKVIGDASVTIGGAGGTDPYIGYSGDYPNRSKFVRVEIHNKTLNYLDENGNVRAGSLSGSLPQAVSGGFFGGSDGDVIHPRAFNENIVTGNSQGIQFTSGQAEYVDAIRLLKNQDEYDINILTLPGVIDNLTDHAPVITEAINMVESRGDCFLVIDPVQHGTTAISTVTAKAEARDSNYVAEYWPWVKIPDNELGRNVWVPASTVIPSVYAFNDRVAAPWFAPAGLNRGGIDIAIQAERKLTHANRDTLYDSNVNPIATFPNAGVTVFGQKTLQKKASALDRVNVRRLLIAAKKFIASSTKFLVFENNTAATRNRFLSIVNPYFENIQQRQGLYAFKVVMDASNNTPDVIDRNEMRGQIFMQPAKTAEFIVVDFNILPTGASFPE